MEKVVNDRYRLFKKYCIQNTPWLEKQPLSRINFNKRKESVLIEFRQLPHLYFILRNTIRVLGSSWSHAVCGNQNYDFVLDIVKINRNIRIIKMDKDNLKRMEYSLMLLKSDFYKQFSGNYLLIYQEDTIIFRDIPNQYFLYDFVGAPLVNNKNAFNGGFSLRNRNKMIQICQNYFDMKKDRFERASIFLEEKIKYLNDNKINYKKNKEFIFLYKIEEALLEDLLLCEKCDSLPNFEMAKEFSVEKFYNKYPVGGHQFWYSLKDLVLWLDINLKNRDIDRCIQ